MTDQEVLDLITGTLNDFRQDKFNNIASAYQKHHILSQVMKKDKVTIGGGVGLDRYVQVSLNGSARQTELFAQDVVAPVDTMKKIHEDWRHTTWNYPYDRREILENQSDSRRIYNLLKTRWSAAWLDGARHMEGQGWTKPADSSDGLNIRGIPTWVVKNATAGFNGGNPTGFAAGAGGLSSTTYPTWANYTDTYAAVTKDDLIEKMRRAARLTSFENPVPIPEYGNRAMPDTRIYTNIDVIQAAERLGEQQNENLGRDLDRYGNQIVFHGSPIEWVPFLDADTEDPLYMLNWNFWEAAVLEGDYMHETGPVAAANAHNTLVMHVDCTWLLMCNDRRAQSVIYNP